MLLNLVKPYQRVTLRFLAKELSLTELEVEKLLVDLIVDGKLAGTIDQPNGYVLLDNKNLSTFDSRCLANLRLINSLTTLSEGLLEAQM